MPNLMPRQLGVTSDDRVPVREALGQRQADALGVVALQQQPPTQVLLRRTEGDHLPVQDPGHGVLVGDQQVAQPSIAPVEHRRLSAGLVGLDPGEAGLDGRVHLALGAQA